MRIFPSAHRRRPHRPRRGLSSFAIALALALPVAAGATIDEPFGGGMPLVLKDGRIATVTVHTVPFETGEDTLDAATAGSLRTIFEPLATDCFLTAQAIGHVAPGITRDGDTLSAHRLARARADAIQAALVDFGMPQPSVASVWDWQFLLPESRATVWVFSLTRGDDCDGTPLPKGEPAVAAVDSEAVSASVETSPTVPSSDEPPDAAIVAAPSPTPPPMPQPAETAPAELRVAEPVRDAPEATATAAAASAAPPTRDPLATAALAPAQPAPAAIVAERPAETPVPETTVAAIDPDLPRRAETAGAPALTITFDMNSSYFPAGAARELRAFLDSLPTEGPIEIELAGAVGTSAVRGASAEEAQRYNAWMAERRIERVAEWLQQNAGNRQITLADKLNENDPSREVRLRANVVSQ